MTKKRRKQRGSTTPSYLRCERLETRRVLAAVFAPAAGADRFALEADFYANAVQPPAVSEPVVHQIAADLDSSLDFDVSVDALETWPTAQVEPTAIDARLVAEVSGFDFVMNHSSRTVILGAVTDKASSGWQTLSFDGSYQVIADAASGAGSDDSLYLRDLVTETLDGHSLSPPSDDATDGDSISETIAPDFGVKPVRAPLADDLATGDDLPSFDDAALVTLDIAANHEVRIVPASTNRARTLADLATATTTQDRSAESSGLLSSVGWLEGVQPMLGRHHRIVVKPAEFEGGSSAGATPSLETSSIDSPCTPTANSVAHLVRLVKLQTSVGSAECSEEPLDLATAVEGGTTVLPVAAAALSPLVPDVSDEQVHRHRWQTLVDVLLAGATGAMIYSSRTGGEAGPHQLRPARRMRRQRVAVTHRHEAT